MYKAITLVLEKTATVLNSMDLTFQENEMVNERLGRLTKLIRDEPNSIGWARIREKRVWYELPEETAE